MHLIAFIAGLVFGGLIAALVARIQIRRSITRLRAAERRSRTTERLAELGAMTGGLAHEIKNPLSTIGLNAQLLGEAIAELPLDAPVPPDERQRLGRRATSLRREVERLRGILADFLSYAGEMRLDQKPADLNGAIDELAEFFLPQAQQQGIRMRTDLAPGALMANLDVPLLKQAALNLMLNAVQAMTVGEGAERNGTRELILRTGRVMDPEGGEMVQLHVIDTGPGIAPEVLPKIFTPYFTTKTGGSGLGLPTTRRIVEAQHGRLEVHSEPGRGTDFSVSFPAL